MVISLLMQFVGSVFVESLEALGAWVLEPGGVNVVDVLEEGDFLEECSSARKCGRVRLVAGIRAGL